MFVSTNTKSRASSEEERKNLLPSQSDASDVSSLEPRRIALPLPGHEVLLEKLSNDAELYKLHVKHYITT